jgi:murein hydrolase activator
MQSPRSGYEPSPFPVVPRLLLALLAALGSGAHAAAQPESDARKAEAELQSVKSEIERATRQLTDDQVERDRLTGQLRSAEFSVGKARSALDAVRKSRAEQAARRAALAAEKHTREGDLQGSRSALAGQLRAAYLIGPQEPVRMLLNQKDPSRAGRMFVYYSYFGQARAREIARIDSDVQAIGKLDSDLEVQDGKLADLEKQQRTQLSELEQARAQRSSVLADLADRSNTHAQALERLKSQQGGLEKLLKELRRALEKFPIDNNDVFAHLRGKLAWPVGGKLVARFGEQRAGGVKWDGVLVATDRGAPVRAVYGGRVIYADWLPGLGLLTIVDHGEGYMSLYGHNERLFKAVGERVSAGDPIGTVGDTGGSNRPELYFEIRKGGKAVDPRPWFKASAP